MAQVTAGAREGAGEFANNIGSYAETARGARREVTLTEVPSPTTLSMSVPPCAWTML